MDPRVAALIEEFAAVLPEELPGLPPEREIEHRIELQEGATPVRRAPYHMSIAEEEAKRLIKEYLTKGFIRASSSPWSAPLLFVRKKDADSGEPALRAVIDYRKLNQISVCSFRIKPLIVVLLIHDDWCHVYAACHGM